MIDAGKMRHLVTVQEPVEERDSFGSVIRKWVTLTRRWAELIPGDLVANPEESEAVTISYTVRMRYMKVLGTQHRLIHKGRLLTINAVVNPDQRGEETVVSAEERVNRRPGR